VDDLGYGALVNLLIHTSCLNTKFSKKNMSKSKHYYSILYDLHISSSEISDAQS
jgi:hypothetical protein